MFRRFHWIEILKVLLMEKWWMSRWKDEDKAMLSENVAVVGFQAIYSIKNVTRSSKKASGAERVHLPICRSFINFGAL
jgi:hypothetical protein